MVHITPLSGLRPAPPGFSTASQERHSSYGMEPGIPGGVDPISSARLRRYATPRSRYFGQITWT